MSNSEIIRNSKHLLKDKYNLVMGPYFVGFLILQLIQTPTNSNNFNVSEVDLYSNFGVSPLVILITGPMTLGLYIFTLAFLNEESLEFKRIFSGFKFYFKALFASVIYLVVVLIGFVLFIIPGIVFAMMFSQVYFIIADNPEVGVIEAFKQSKAMMHGHKWQFFILSLRYAFYFLLGIFTLFIWWLWLIPQNYITFGLFYKNISKKELTNS
jgi:uncharacterized membrane protein